jgi:hypothetical protein
MGAPVELIKPLLVALTYEAKAPHPTDARLAWPPSGGVERPRLRANLSLTRLPRRVARHDRREPPIPAKAARMDWRAAWVYPFLR